MGSSENIQKPANQPNNAVSDKFGAFLEHLLIKLAEALPHTGNQKVPTSVIRVNGEAYLKSYIVVFRNIPDHEHHGECLGSLLITMGYGLHLRVGFLEDEDADETNHTYFSMLNTAETVASQVVPTFKDQFHSA